MSSFFSSGLNKSIKNWILFDLKFMFFPSTRAWAISKEVEILNILDEMVAIWILQRNHMSFILPMLTQIAT